MKLSLTLCVYWRHSGCRYTASWLSFLASSLYLGIVPAKAFILAKKHLSLYFLRESIRSVITHSPLLYCFTPDAHPFVHLHHAAPSSSCLMAKTSPTPPSKQMPGAYSYKTSTHDPTFIPCAVPISLSIVGLDL
jgi:hypothetical protein